ncbi:MAG: OmpH family outer membrane protein [Desulfovibrionaceae bacterium]|jgi:outer membrane protein|nr:OmpH family outer membrane protein [Desulfovibrionaceae bacterium]
MQHNRLFLPLFLALTLLAAAAAAAPDTWAREPGRVGFIDFQRIISESSIGKAAQKDIDALRAEKEKTFEQSMDAIKKLEDTINNSYDTKPEERRKMIDALHKKYREHEKMIADTQDELQREEVKLYTFVLKHTQDVLRDVARREGYDMIIRDPEVIGFVDPAVDITDLVLKELDTRK